MERLQSPCAESSDDDDLEVVCNEPPVFSPHPAESMVEAFSTALVRVGSRAALGLAELTGQGPAGPSRRFPQRVQTLPGSLDELGQQPAERIATLPLARQRSFEL
ncbi:unnamed protein product, partial [Polarella glacialis]